MGIADKLFQMKNEKAAANLKAGQDFLEENKKRAEVTELESGLQYEVLIAGEGEKPWATNTVTCHYHGTLIDGTVFDSSVQRGQPASFPLNMVIKGWTEGLQLMPMGSKYRFFIPPHLGYGDRQVSAQIGSNSTLIFDVELISFK
jgi:FKBP-type peptidyl-prolyl cis-trans isomerase FklB